jgi:hypothetical protein
MSQSRTDAKRPRSALRWALARLVCALGVLITMVVAAAACAICLSGWVVTIGQQLDAADQAALAVPMSGGQEFRVVAVVKGGAVADAIIAEPVARVDPAALAGRKPLLLLRNELGQQWSSVGPIAAEYAGWLRLLGATGLAGPGRKQPAWPQSTRPSSELTDAQWRERVALVAPHLESSEPLAAEIAYGEISRAPYGILRSVKSQLDVVAIARWIDDPKLAARRSTYVLLLGISGGPEDATRLEQRIDAAWQSQDVTDLAAMLAADLELRGPSRVNRIEEMYLADGNRTLPEIEAALLALSVHGGADGAVRRERIIQAYRLFMQTRKPMAGFVAQELADWAHWEATSEFVALLKSDAVKDPASHFAIVNYLQRSPRAAAKAALRSLAVESK